jgi:murein DD-endopeptidase MepM/ murein hydrolase activator NlpD
MLIKTAPVRLHAEPWIRRGAALALFMVMGGALAHAADIGSATLDLPSLIPVAVAEPAPQLEPVVIWQGADLDGDGADDFVNPTGGETRGHDAYGDGAFGASRDGGDRHHEGVDYVAQAGQDVVAPISGYVTRIGYPYGNDSKLRYVEISNPALHYTARAFYVAPTVQEGDAVQLGEVIGKAESLQRRYNGITDHVHLEIVRAGRHLDAATLISSRTEMQPRIQLASSR